MQIVYRHLFSLDLFKHRDYNEMATDQHIFYLEMLKKSELPISFHGKILRGQSAKDMLKIITLSLKNKATKEVIFDILQTKIEVDNEDLDFTQLYDVSKLEKLHEQLMMKNVMVGTLPFDNIDSDEYIMTPSAPPLDSQTIPNVEEVSTPASVNPKIVELQRDTNGFGISVQFPWGFRKKIKVTKVEDDSHAALLNVKEGDKLKSIEINGKDISKSSKSKILKLWKNADKIVLKY